MQVNKHGISRLWDISIPTSSPSAFSRLPLTTLADNAVLAKTERANRASRSIFVVWRLRQLMCCRFSGAGIWGRTQLQMTTCMQIIPVRSRPAMLEAQMQPIDVQCTEMQGMESVISLFLRPL